MIDERLLIEATPELLEGWCGPVVFRWHHHGPKRAYMVSWDGDLYDDCGPVEDPDQYRDGLHFDLARAECRDRVARVAWGRVAEPHCRRSPDSGPYKGAVVLIAWTYDGVLVECPTDQDLDPHDDTRLPDGSRLVDALALAAVWRSREVSRG